MTIDQIRKLLIAAVKTGKKVVVTSKKDSQECIARGEIRSVSPSYVVITWASGETIVPINSIVDVGDENPSTAADDPA